MPLPRPSVLLGDSYGDETAQRLIAFRQACTASDVNTAIAVYQRLRSMRSNVLTVDITADTVVVLPAYLTAHSPQTTDVRHLACSDFYALLDLLIAYSTPGAEKLILHVYQDMLALNKSLPPDYWRRILMACYQLAHYVTVCTAFQTWWQPRNLIPNHHPHAPNNAKYFRDPEVWRIYLTCHWIIYRNSSQLMVNFQHLKSAGCRPTLAILTVLVRGLAHDTQWHLAQVHTVLQDGLAYLDHPEYEAAQLGVYLIVWLLQRSQWQALVETMETLLEYRIALSKHLCCHVLKRLMRARQLALARRFWDQAFLPTMTDNVFGRIGLAELATATRFETLYPRLNTVTLNCYLDGLVACGHLAEAQDIFISLGNVACLSSRKTARCTALSKESRLVLSHCRADVQTYTIMLHAHLAHHNHAEAQCLVRDLVEHGWSWDPILVDVIYTALWQYHYQSRDPVEPLADSVLAQHLLPYVPAHHLSSVFRVHSTLLQLESLVGQGGQADWAKNYQTMKTHHSSVMAALERLLFQQAVAYFDDPWLLQHHPNDLNLILRLLFQRNHWQRCLRLVQLACNVTEPCVITPITVNIVMQGLLVHGRYLEAFRLLQGSARLPQRLRQEGFIVLFRAYCHHGDVEHALQAFMQLAQWDRVVHDVFAQVFGPLPPENFRLVTLPKVPQTLKPFTAFSPLVREAQRSGVLDHHYPIPLFVYHSLFLLLFRTRQVPHSRLFYALFVEVLRRYDVLEEYTSGLNPSGQALLDKALDALAKAAHWPSPVTKLETSTLPLYNRPRWNKDLSFILLRGWVALNQLDYQVHTCNEIKRHRLMVDPRSSLGKLMRRVEETASARASGGSPFDK
ncbi:hypothetical protein H4R35_003222 [Dimargaris xerosporica]|nr:hypothetical protein H4R35_003222 [Dimargaris xerosporica]